MLSVTQKVADWHRTLYNSADRVKESLKKTFHRSTLRGPDRLAQKQTASAHKE